jgi:PII-like signaling protein
VTREPGKLLRFYITEHDQYSGKPLYQAMIDRCRELNVAGVTVFRGLEGFGETAELHRPHLLQSDLPIVITIVERPDKAQQILPVLESMLSSGVVAVSDVEVTVILDRKRTRL